MPDERAESYELTADGVAMRTMRWHSTQPAWATLLLVHGVGEHAGRYDSVARQMAGVGIEVHAYDHRGFGASGGPRSYVARWSVFHDDLETRLAMVRASSDRLPLVLYGHSMGGLIALGYVLAEARRALPDLLVLTSPGLDSTIATWKQMLAPILSRIAPRLRIPIGFRPGDLSRDPAVDERVAADPLCLSGSTTRLGAEAFAEQKRVRTLLADGGQLPVPTYVIHGADDPIVPVAASEILDGRPNVTRRVYPGLRHETHNEPEGATVVDDTIAWLRENTRSRRR
ncbi:MAG: lysophospholipase [Candidatus Limnocylindria bacterium]